MKPLVGVGVVNYNGAGMTIECLDHLRKLDWPAERLRIVVVDNASTDDSVDRLLLVHPDVELVRSNRNRGFAGGSNLAIEALGDVDYIALVNNDARVDPGWLEPLVQTLEADASLGAACPKILFATRYGELVLESETFSLRGDRRRFGIRVSGVVVNGVDRTEDCQYPSGFWAAQPAGEQRVPARWTDGKGVLLVPVENEGDMGTCRIEVCAEASKSLVIHSGQRTEHVDVTTVPRWIELELPGKPVDMINNAGSELVDHKHAADRGIYQIDRGQFDKAAYVFAWCGCSVLLSHRYLADVGLFDEAFFLYYEDFDLSWRGQRRGWRYAYVPHSTVRHLHAATTRANSELFNFYVSRNRLLVLLKNASVRVAAQQAFDYTAKVFRQATADLWTGTLSPSTAASSKVLLSFLLRSPGAILERIRGGVRNKLKRLGLGASP